MSQFDQDYPFRTSLSLEPVMEYWRQSAAPLCPDLETMYRSFRDYLDANPELSGLIDDPAVLEKHSFQVHGIMSVIMPIARWEVDLTGAFVPFTMDPVLASPKLQKILDSSFRMQPVKNPSRRQELRMLRVYLYILRECYDLDLNFDPPLQFTSIDPETELERYYRIELDLRFVTVKRHGGPDRLTERQRQDILANPADLETLRRILPPEQFEFAGISVVQAVDVTENQAIADLEHDTTDPSAILTRDGMEAVQNRLRIIFGRPDLKAGLCAFHENKVLVLHPKASCQGGCAYTNSTHHNLDEFKDSLFGRVYESGEMEIIEDFRTASGLTAQDRRMAVEYGWESIVAAPLFDHDQVIGILVIKGVKANDLGQIDRLRIEKLIPIFSLTIRRTIDGVEAQVESIIKQQCTAVHPSLDWRFRQAALNVLDRRQRGESDQMEPIAFNNVYPLFGQADIRGSSVARNQAAQDDLTEHIDLALTALKRCNRDQQVPFVGVLAQELDGFKKRLGRGLHSGDETSLVNFIHGEVEPVLEELGQDDLAATDAVRRYWEAIDPEIGTVYRQRRRFEEAVDLLSSRLADYLAQEQAKVQAVFPHYFEKHRTDGIDYMIYVGQSMVQNRRFKPFHVHNLRLWQLMTACGMARLSEQVKSELSAPLEVCHLILFHHNPLSTAFRFDEKKFDVDGAYDIRYEIIKSRLDKAVAVGTGERLTQPGRIAVVYSQDQEAVETRRYLDYIKDQGFILPNYEELEIDELPGVHGLKALRATVNLRDRRSTKRAELTIV